MATTTENGTELKVSQGYFGRAMKRVEDPRLIKGIATYVDDLKLPGVLHAEFVRSPHAHANILSIRGAVCLLIGPVVHFATRMLISLDHNMFRIIRLGAETRGIQIRGVSVLWAMPWRPPSRAKDVESSV